LNVNFLPLWFCFRLRQARRAAIDRYLLPAGRSAANPPHAVGQTRGLDERTLDRFIDSAPHAGSANKMVQGGPIN